MKRLHVHISVDNLAAARRFYAAMLGAEPAVEKPDYVKWLLDDPRVNLAISERAGTRPGLNHLGIQAENRHELGELWSRLSDASVAMLDEKGAKCCYAESDKHWAVDPAGVVWEMFHTKAEVATCASDPGPAVPAAGAAAAEACQAACCPACTA